MKGTTHHFYQKKKKKSRPNFCLREWPKFIGKDIRCELGLNPTSWDHAIESKNELFTPKMGYVMALFLILQSMGIFLAIDESMGHGRSQQPFIATSAGRSTITTIGSVPSTTGLAEHMFWIVLDLCGSKLILFDLEFVPNIPNLYKVTR